MLPASEFFGSSLEDLRVHFGITLRPKRETARKVLEGGCLLLSPKAWRKRRTAIVPLKKSIE
jgi:hypothetical protein